MHLSVLPKLFPAPKLNDRNKLCINKHKVVSKYVTIELMKIAKKFNNLANLMGKRQEFPFSLAKVIAST
jgi:hypothetical protein